MLQIGSPSLPVDINSIASYSLEPLVLQIVSSMDASIPTRCKTVCKDGKRRMLLLRLTDGCRECQAMEYHHVPALQHKVLIPGMKIRLVGAVVRYGIILLTPNCVELLGGYIKDLAEAFEAQVLYGDLAKQRKGLGSETGTPPRFQHFDPSRRRRPPPTASGDPRDSVKNNNARTDGRNSNRTTSTPDSVSEQKEPAKSVIDSVDNVAASVASSKINTVAAESLLKKMEKKSGENRKGRERSRRARNEERFSAPKMTLDEWEAKNGGKQAPDSTVCSDHELAVSMQNQFDLEDSKGASSAGLQTELLGMFYSENVSTPHHALRGKKSSISRGKGRRGRWRGA